MIPEIPAILEMVKAGECTVQKAIAWIAQHMENADLLDTFAAAALAGGLLEAKPAYALARAMLAERARKAGEAEQSELRG